MDAIVYLNGQYCAAEQAKVSVLDRGFLFADGVYEVMRVHNGAPFMAGEHFARMSRGLQAIEIPSPLTRAEHDELCRELIGRNGVDKGLVYLQVTRGAGAARAHAPQPGLTPTVVGWAQNADLPGWKKTPQGAEAVLVEDSRWGRCDIKTIMLMPNGLAKKRAHEAGAFEAVLVAADGVVREGSSSNLFAVIAGKLRTHPADRRILGGITRRLVLDMAARQGTLPIEERAMTREELFGADEVFLSGTTTDICPVIRIEGRPVGGGSAGPVTRRLIEAYYAFMERECPVR